MADDSHSQNKILSFSKLLKQVHTINDIILSDIILEDENDAHDELQSFNLHIQSTKHWFMRISGFNKKRYLLILLEDLRSAWALSLLLKSIWNCRPKDAVLSTSNYDVWSSYDQMPIDHNRTARPNPALAQVMKDDHTWFMSLEPESQAMVLSELLKISGGPVMWEVLSCAQVLYESYQTELIEDLRNSIMMNEPSSLGVSAGPLSPNKNKKDSPGLQNSGNIQEPVKPQPSSPAQHKLEENLAAWALAVKSLRESMKLEEIEMTFNDGTTKKIWKVNRPKPDIVETVDFVQLLPSAVGKRIISYLPRASLGDYAKVNKYWAYLVDEFRAELLSRQKINADLDKLQELILRHQDNTSDVIPHADYTATAPICQGVLNAFESPKQFYARQTTRPTGVVLFKHDGKMKPYMRTSRPLRKLSELTGHLDRRGAADESIWIWCRNTIRHNRSATKPKLKSYDGMEGVLPAGIAHFPCPLMKIRLEVPLEVPLFEDPTVVKHSKPRGGNIMNATVLNMSKASNIKRYSLWTKDYSNLYSVLKIPSYLSPI